MLPKLAAIGIMPGTSFDPGGLDPAVARGLDAAPKEGQAKVMGHLPAAGQNIKGWMIILGAGLYGTDYLLRALLNTLGPGWNRPIHAIYPMSLVDVNGQPCDGGNNYVLRFAKDQLPPVEAFWSLTIYEAKDRFLVPNPLDRYAVGSRSPFTADNDGSIDIYIQHDSPGKAQEANWLPAPAGQFGLFLRLYRPSTAPPTILDGTWQPPAVTRLTERSLPKPETGRDHGHELKRQPATAFSQNDRAKEVQSIGEGRGRGWPLNCDVAALSIKHRPTRNFFLHNPPKIFTAALDTEPPRPHWPETKGQAACQGTGHPLQGAGDHGGS